MRLSVSVLAILFALFIAPPARAQEAPHTAPQSALDAALRQHTDTSSADREMIQRLLERDEVKTIAGQAGLDLRRAQGAVATLEGDDLAEVAAQARQTEQALAGGQSRVTISTTLIIVALLVLILLIVALK
jgi:hypothetical protein